MAISESLGERCTLDIGEGRIEYRTRGRGPTIVFLHGIIANGDVWRGVVDAIAPRYRCVVPDWPLGGHRLAMPQGTDFSLPGLARIVARFLAKASLENVLLVGSDTGGAVAQHVVASHYRTPGRVTEDQAEIVAAAIARFADDRVFVPQEVTAPR